MIASNLYPIRCALFIAVIATVSGYSELAGQTVDPSRSESSRRADRSVLATNPNASLQNSPTHKRFSDTGSKPFQPIAINLNDIKSSSTQTMDAVKMQKTPADASMSLIERKISDELAVAKAVQFKLTDSKSKPEESVKASFSDSADTMMQPSESTAVSAKSVASQQTAPTDKAEVDAATKEYIPTPQLLDPELFRVNPERQKKLAESTPAEPTRNVEPAKDENGVFTTVSSSRRLSNRSVAAKQELDLPPLDKSEIKSSMADAQNVSTNRTLSDFDGESIDFEALADSSLQNSLRESSSQSRSQADGSTLQLPTYDLNQGINIDPMASAFSPHTPGDPYLAGRAYAPEYRDGATYKTKTWRSPNLKHRPLYFEEASLERHGLGHPKLQPAISGAKFFSSVALLPQKVLATPPTECVHPVGHRRPGNCVPTVSEKLPRKND